MRALRRGGTGVFLLLMLVACERASSPVTPSPACSFGISPSSQSFSSDGGTATVTVTTTPACAWTAASGFPWIAVVTGASATGTGTVAYSVGANPATEPRSGSLTVAGQSVAVTQAARDVSPCTFALSPDRVQVGEDAGSGTFAVAAPADCAWDAKSSADWLTIVSGSPGKGTGTVSYAFTKHSGTSERTGTIAVADQTFRVAQRGDADACAYVVEPVTFTPCIAGGVVTASVRTAPGCSWTATAGAAWLTIDSGSSGSGSRSIAIRFGDNYDAPRDGVVMVRWPSPTAGQNIRVAQAGCVYAVSRGAISAVAAGGTATFDVLQQSQPTSCGGPLQDRCVWTARSDVSWITVTTSMPRTGDGSVSLAIAANPATASRTGHVTVRDKAVTVTQAGQ